MKIGIDIQSIVGNKTGIGYYTYNLITGIKKMDYTNTYYFYNTGEILNVAHRIFWEQIRLPILARKDRIDLLHSPGFSCPIVRHCKTIVTVHDLIGAFFPYNLACISRIYWSKYLPYAISKADKIIADSYNTKDDIIRLLKARPEKIKVIYPSISNEFRSMSDLQELIQIRKKYNLPAKYILHVGTIEPRKNLETLIRAFSRIKKTINPEYKLLLVGAKGWAYKDLLLVIESCNLGKDVIFTDYIEEKDLPYIYNVADLFVLPSLYEGFGLPLLEAMASGIPIIASNSSCIPEILDDAGIVFDPKSIDELSLAIERVLKNGVLKNDLRNKGLERARAFDSEKMIKNILAEYQN